MPSLFTLPGPRSGPDNFTTQYVLPLNGTYTVDAGTSLYGSVPLRMFWGDYNYPTFINNGTLWNISDSVSGIVAGFYIVQVTNTGTMISQATNGNAWDVSVGSGGEGVFNSGSMYSIANGHATVIEHWDPNAYIENSGLLAAYAPQPTTGGGAQAIGIAMFNGGVIVNDAGGSILAEGLNADGIIFGRGSLFGDDVILNNGRIEALSLTPGTPSYGVLAGGVQSEILKLVNNGILKADIAWSSYTAGPYAPAGTDILTNTTGGTIIGRIETGPGDDSFVNNGSMTGNVDLGDDNDLFDTSGGTWTGSADLGWGDDSFFGSAAGDIVKGNRGDDHLVGNGGNDLLLGGIGADWIDGGAGNDGLYGEIGDDRIIQQGGDRIYGGDGNDRIELSDFTFSIVDGGNGYDTLVLPSGTRLIDLSAVASSGRLSNIEEIDLGGSKELVVRTGDVAALSGGAGQLVIGARSTDKVDLVGTWTNTGPVAVSGVTYGAYASSGVTVLVQQGAVVVTGAAAPSGATGLDAVAAGGDAPAAGSVPGGELSNPVQQISMSLGNKNIVVDVGETWQATNASVITGFSLTNGVVNAGSIEASNGQAISNDVAFIINSGTIRGTGSGGATAIHIRGTLINSGTVEAVADSGRALAAEVGNSATTAVFDNRGMISARSPDGAAIGAQIDYANNHLPGPVGTNEGRIEATGGAGTLALSVLTGGTFVNNGTIVAANSSGSSATDAIAVQLWNNSPLSLINTFVNHGSVSGPTALQSAGGMNDIVNDGQIQGAIQLGSSVDSVENTGSITGRISLGDGTDIYYGAAATAGAEVDGGSGVDLLVGGAQADHLEGGAGNDGLIGGGGGDLLIGGAGADRFIYLSANDSTAAAPDTIQDFETGIDRIDLSAVAPTSVSLSTSGSVTTITAQTADGVMAIKVSGTVALSDIDTAPASSILNGSAAGEVLTAAEIHAGAGDDVLLGTSGNDLLDGGAGADLMYGGAGDDVYLVDNQADHVIERAGGGVDLVIASTNYALPANVENLTLASAAQGTGNELDNVMVGSSGNDSLFAGNGNDTLIGGLGADSLFGGPGNDVFVYKSAADSTAAAPDVIGGFEYGVDKIDLSAIHVLSMNWTRVLDQFNSYEDVRIVTADGPMEIKVTILNVATSGLSMSDFIVQRHTAPHDFNGDGFSDIILRNTNGQLTDWLGSSNGALVDNSAVFSVNPGTDWHVVGTGDFNGDGLGDVLWRNDSGAVVTFLGAPNGSFVGNVNFNLNPGLDWHVAGTGDFNGDGRDDILWRNDTGTVVTLLGNPDGSFTGNVNFLLNPGVDWHIEGTGDFNGDGRSDILWRNDIGTVVSLLGNADGSFTGNVNFKLNPGLDWHVEGTGDFNGDGRADILWRNDIGTVVDLLGNPDGSFTGNVNFNLNPGLDWHIVGTGDYNGDGYDDILWRNDSGTLTDLLGQPNGAFIGNVGNFTATPDLDWRVQPDLHASLV